MFCFCSRQISQSSNIGFCHHNNPPDETSPSSFSSLSPSQQQITNDLERNNKRRIRETRRELQLYSEFDPEVRSRLPSKNYQGIHQFASVHSNMNSGDVGASSSKIVCPHCRERIKTTLNHRCWFHDSSKFKNRISSLYEDQKKTEKEILRIQEKLKVKKKELKSSKASSSRAHSL